MKINNEAHISKVYLEKLEDILNQLINENVELNLSNLEQIKIVDNIENTSSDGRFENNTIILPKNKMEDYIKKDDTNTIKSTIYHELCHVDLKNKLPQLHNLSEKYRNNEDYIKYFTIMVYIEYISHIMSSKYETDEIIKRFLESVNNRMWNFNDEITRMYFIKCMPYVLGRINKHAEYINIIKNNEVKRHIVEAKEIIKRIQNENLVDDYNILIELENYISKYISND